MFFRQKFSPNFEFRRLPNRVRLFRKMYHIANAVTGHFKLFEIFSMMEPADSNLRKSRQLIWLKMTRLENHN